jgi:adenylate kinase
VRNDTPLGREAKSYMDRGELVPDDVTIRMLLERLTQPDAAGGVILDGFPRTVAQARALDAALSEHGSTVERVPYIDAPVDELVARLSGRWICRAAGHPYHDQLEPPRTAGTCDIDGSELYQRADDQPDVVKARLAAQLPPLGEVADHYERSGTLVRIDGRQPVDAVTRDLLAALQPVAPERT